MKCVLILLALLRQDAWAETPDFIANGYQAETVLTETGSAIKDDGVHKKGENSKQFQHTSLLGPGESKMEARNTDLSGERSLQECAEIVTIDFATSGNGVRLKHGEYVKYEWLQKYGLTIDASSVNMPEGSARVFDTAKASKEAPGLNSPNENCIIPGHGQGQGGKPGSPGENCNPSGEGNILIIQDASSSDPKDDTASGTITFTFDEPIASFLEIGLIDIGSTTPSDTDP